MASHLGKLLLAGVALLLVGCGGGGGTASTGGGTAPTATTASALSISASSASVESDNVDSVTITVHAKNAANFGVEGVVVNFTSTGGLLSFPTGQNGTTDANGAASVILRSGTDRANRTVTVTASVAGVGSVQIPIQVVGSSATITASTSNLTVGGAGTTVTVTVRDANGNPVDQADVSLSATGTGSVSIAPAQGKTGFAGTISATVTGLTPGDVTLTATGLGATATSNFTVASSAAAFGVTSPTEDPATMVTGGTLPIVVAAPTQANVRFSTTLGSWTECPGQRVCTRPANAGTATATLTSTQAGLANIQVDGMNILGTVTVSDSKTVAITATVAASLVLQAESTNVAPSIGDTDNTVTLIATVRDATGQPVGGVPVAFSLVNPTGGGEKITPVVDMSNNGSDPTLALGQVKATFTSGSLPSGQNQSSVRVRAEIVNSAVPAAEVGIVIGGVAGSIAIGQSSEIQSDTTNTYYEYAMSVLVSDSNGNAVPNTRVSLGVWPTLYYQGTWNNADPCGPVITAGPLSNEDDNRNVILDGGEDDNGDGLLTPPSSSAGSLPSSVVTDANGVATFVFRYLKSSAVWIVAEIRATAIVQGSETTSRLTLGLPYAVPDKCLLFPSPFN